MTLDHAMSSSSELDNDDEEVDLREVESGGFLTLGGSGNNEQEEEEEEEEVDVEEEEENLVISQNEEAEKEEEEVEPVLIIKTERERSESSSSSALSCTFKNKRGSTFTTTTVSSSLRAKTPGPVSIERPACTLRRKANIPINSIFVEKVIHLERERTRCEKLGEYDKCQLLTTELEKSKAEEELRRVSLMKEHHTRAKEDAEIVKKKAEEALRERHENERMETNASFQELMEKFNAKRSVADDEFEIECTKMRKRAESRKPKARAKELSEMRSIQDALMKQRRYREAGETRMKADGIEKNAMVQTVKMIECDLAVRKAKLKERYDREEGALLARHNTLLRGEKRRMEEETISLYRKFRGIFAELKNVEKVEMFAKTTTISSRSSNNILGAHRNEIHFAC